MKKEAKHTIEVEKFDQARAEEIYKKEERDEKKTHMKVAKKDKKLKKLNQDREKVDNLRT